MRSALAVLEGKAHRGRTEPVYTRIGSDGSAVFFDLCNSEWSAVAINATGWEVVPSENVPMYVVRSPRALGPFFLESSCSRLRLDRVT